MTITVVLVDDQFIVRAGLHLLLQSQPDMQVIGEADNADAAHVLCAQLRPDVVVIGLDQGDVRAARTIKQQHPSAVIVALSDDESRQHFFEMAQAGASVYLPRSAAITELVNAIRAARTGEMVVHPGVASMLVHGLRQRAASERNVPDRVGLTAQERQFVDMLADGAPNKEIAARLGVSLRTVARYQASILRKLELHNRAELVRYAVDR
jgi:two-component system response regulator NreC